MTQRGPHQSLRIAGALGALLAALAPAGCNIAGPVYYFIHGPEKRPAAYTLNPELKTVFFIDDRASRLPRRSLVSALGVAAEEALLAAEAVEPQNMIAAVSTQRAAAAEKHGDLLSIAEIGRAAGADVVIYVSIEGFTLSHDGATLQPVAGAYVKVISVAEDKRLWPDTASGQPLRLVLPAGATPPTERSAIAQLELGLAKSLGVEIARLFYAHEPDHLGDRRRPS